MKAQFLLTVDGNFPPGRLEKFREHVQTLANVCANTYSDGTCPAVALENLGSNKVVVDADALLRLQEKAGVKE